MIEKSFEKTYQMKGCNGIKKSVLTRTANRLIADYSAVFGGSCIPEEIKKISEQIKECVDTEEYEYEYTYESLANGVKTYDKVRYTTEERACAFWGEDDYGNPVYCVRFYFFTSEFYTKRVGNQTLHAGSYTEILKKSTAAKGKYRYFCTHRPPSSGVIPNGFVSYDTYSQSERYIGEVTYNEKPSDDELTNWGLIFDKDWERLRAAYAEVD